MLQTVLVIEDDPDIRHIVRVYLEKAGYRVAVADNGVYGLSLALNSDPLLIVLDWMLPQLDGPQFMQRLRERSDVPVIMLTARGEEEDRLQGFALGVDDYVVKPFSPRELTARIKAVAARVRQRTPGARRVEYGDLVIDPQQRSVSLQGQPVALTQREFDVLEFLAQHPGRVFPRSELLERIRDPGEIGVDRVVDVHISNLRAKIEADASRPRYIQTVRGVGYRFGVPGNER